MKGGSNKAVYCGGAPRKRRRGADPATPRPYESAEAARRARARFLARQERRRALARGQAEAFPSSWEPPRARKRKPWAALIPSAREIVAWLNIVLAAFLIFMLALLARVYASNPAGFVWAPL